MSLPQLQKAVALLIRFPDENRGEDLERFLGDFDLRQEEKSQLRDLSNDRMVAKYGRSMFGMRWETVTKNIKLAKNYLAPDTLDFIFRTYFDPKTIAVPLWQLSRAFFDFIVEDADACRVLTEQAPPFITDIFKFERAQLLVWWRLREGKPISEESSLASSAFEFVDLDFDILDLLNRMRDEESVSADSPEPIRRRVKLLIIPQENTKESRFFEIDDTLQAFLEGQREIPPKKVELPDCYETLVNLGLCKPLVNP